ncbi:hypothetical protein K438DRAFT_1755262 [Mycena galopus ATCC 62051]|nr:hypothetical protein K438DRAFT_1755262 [Mycena galopus ATCC 62051]
MPSITRRIRSTLTSDAFAARMRQVLSNQIASDAFDATKVVLKAIQASADACAPLKSGVSAALVLLEMSELLPGAKSQRIKSNKGECEHLAERAAQIVQDIWRQTKDFNMLNSRQRWRGALLRSKCYSKKSKTSLMGSRKRRFDNDSLAKIATRAKSRSMDDYWTRECRSSVIHRLHVEHIAADEKRHDAVLSASQMSDAERLQLLTWMHDPTKKPARKLIPNSDATWRRKCKSGFSSFSDFLITGDWPE